MTKKQNRPLILKRNHSREYILKPGLTPCWIIIDNISLQISRSEDDTVRVNAFEEGNELEAALTTMVIPNTPTKHK